MSNDTKEDVIDHYAFPINSSSRISGIDANMVYSIELPPNHKFNRVVVNNAAIPRSDYIVQNGYNTFQLQEAKGTVTITVPPGNYTRSSFQKALQAILIANSPGGLTYAITYPATAAAADTGLYTYTVTGGTASFIIGTSLYEQMGFNKNVTVTLPATSTNVIKMIQEDTLVLHSNIVDSFNKDILCVFVAGTDPPFSTTRYECRDVKMNARKLKKVDSNSYEFRLTDENGIIIDLNGLNWTCELIFFTA